jgi:hypothetical protein
MERARDRTSTPGHPEAGCQEGITNDPSWQETLPRTCDAIVAEHPCSRRRHEAPGRPRGAPLRQREGHPGSHAPVTGAEDGTESNEGRLGAVLSRNAGSWRPPRWEAGTRPRRSSRAASLIRYGAHETLPTSDQNRASPNRRRDVGQQKGRCLRTGPDLHFLWWRGFGSIVRPSGDRPDEAAVRRGCPEQPSGRLPWSIATGGRSVPRIDESPAAGRRRRAAVTPRSHLDARAVRRSRP